MKTNFKTILFCAALLALPLGCQKGMDTQDKGEVSWDGFEAIVKEVLKDAGTKTYLTDNDEIAWSEKDTVLVIGKNNTSAKMIVAVLGDDATHGFLTRIDAEYPEPATTGKKYTAYYPAGIFSGATAAAGTGKLPASYDFITAQASPLKCLPMYATSNDKTLEFKTACGVLELSMKGVMTVTKVKLTSDDPISGDFKINPVTDSVTFNGTVDSVVINFGTDGVALNRVAGVKIYLPLCKGTYHNVKLRVFTKEMTENGGTCEHTYPVIDIRKGEIHANEFTVDRDAVQLWAGGPYFATCNLGAPQPADYGSKYMWGSTEKIYENNDIQSGTSGTFTFKTSPTDYSKGFAWASYINVDKWDGKTSWASSDDDATSSSTFVKYHLTGSVLSESDDVTRKLWAGSWRMPAAEDFTALGDNCFWEWTTTYKNAAGNDVTGFIVYAAKAESHRNIRRNGSTLAWITAPAGGGTPADPGTYDYTTDTHVFFPAAGYGDSGVTLNSAGVEGRYWSNALFTTSRYGNNLRFNVTDVYLRRGGIRSLGYTVRPVHD